MIALDTNVLIRALTQDEPDQARRAAEALRRPSLWIAKSVLLEAEWVLRSAYGFEATRVGEALQRIVGLENVEVEDRPAVVQALAWSAVGLDFADALHVASSATAHRFATFDRPLVRAAREAATEPPVEEV